MYMYIFIDITRHRSRRSVYTDIEGHVAVLSQVHISFETKEPGLYLDTDTVIDIAIDTDTYDLDLDVVHT